MITIHRFSSRCRVGCLLAVFLAAAAFNSRSAAAVSISVADDGIAVDAGVAGKFVLTYPELLDDQQKTAHKLIQKTHVGNKAVLKYDGNFQIDVELHDGGDISYALSAVPKDVRSLLIGAVLDFSYSTGGAYQVNRGDTTPFPRDKPAKPHLFQGPATSLLLKGVLGRPVRLGFPEYAFLDLQDNREWGWKAFYFKVVIPMDPNVLVRHLQVTSDSAGPAPPTVLVDRFGQSTRDDFPQKLKSEDALKADVEAEKAYYGGLRPPAFDAFGGLPDSGRKLGLKRSGFFHVEGAGDRWNLVDPAGNAFYALGVCGYSPVDDYTLIKGREQIYAWLPPADGEFRSAFRPEDGGRVLSFHLANQIRKYGKPYDPEQYTARMLDRLRKWGFNCAGPFSAPRAALKEASFPYVLILPLGQWDEAPISQIPGISGTWDPFDAQNRLAVEKNFSRSLPARADDPLLVGYFLSNEPLFEDVPRVVPGLDGKFACKRRLVEMLKAKYNTIDAFDRAWGMHAETFDALKDAGLPVSSSAAAADMQAFVDLFFETYYKLVSDTFHKYDRNHMLIGNRFQSGTINNERLLKTAGRYMDIISFNYYTYGIDRDFLRRIHAWSGRPLMLTEYYFDAPHDSGLPGGGKDVNSQEQRGLAYRNYVEQSASLGYVLGDLWFSLVDQSLTGRFFENYSGENANSGLIAVTDRPWKPMLQQAMLTNYEIYKVALGERPTFAWNDPRFTVSAVAHRGLMIPHAAGPVKMDGTSAGFPGAPAEQLPASRLVMGADAGGVEASFKLCWDNSNLYVRVEVADPTPMRNNQKGDMLWSGDAVELFVGSNEVDQGGALRFDDHQVLLSAGLPDGKPQWYITQLPQQPACRMAVVPNVDGKGYTLEAALPFSALGFVPAAGKEIRFDIGVDDSADGSRRVRQFMWNGTDRNSSDRTGWGRATFGH